MRRIDKIILHCTANRPGSKVNAASIRKYHIEERGFEDIGYHFVILEDGTIERGRALSKPGAHCFGHNKTSIGIAYAGGLNKNGKGDGTRTAAQGESMFWLCCLLEEWLLREQSVMVCCWGHNEFSDKPCPCFDVTMWEMDWDERKMASVTRFMRVNPIHDLPDEIDWADVVTRCRQFHDSWFAGKAESKKSRQDGESRK